MRHPLTLKWNVKSYAGLRSFVDMLVKRSGYFIDKIPIARKMPTLTALGIGASKKMNAAILFFDFEDFTSITSRLPPEKTLMILYIATTTVMRIVREWNGTVEKHTGDGVMAIIGTETPDLEEIAQEAIEIAQTIRYVMVNDVIPLLVQNGLPHLNFRIGIEMGEVLISRIGLPKMNFLTAVGSPANRASKLEGLARKNGISIGEDLVLNLHSYLHGFIEEGDDESWDWFRYDGITSYRYYHYHYEWGDPKLWPKERAEMIREIRRNN